MKTTTWTQTQIEVAANDVIRALLDHGVVGTIARLATLTGHDGFLVLEAIWELEKAGLVESNGAGFTYSDAIEHLEG